MTRRTLGSVVVSVAVLVLSQVVWAVAPKAQTAKPQAAEAGVNANANAGANAGALPNVDEIHQAFEQGNYKETLQKLSRVLMLRGDAAKVYDRHDLLRLKGETQLKLKDATGAASSFEQAAKEAKEDKDRAVDLATQLLIKRSRNLTFTPAPKKGAKAADKAADKAVAKAEPIDISDPEKRKAAFEALLAEQKEQVEPKLKGAKDAKTLPPVIEALYAAGSLRTLELAATGEDAQVSAMVKDLTGRAQKMMTDALKKMTDTVNQIEESANRLQEVMTPVRAPGLGGGAGLGVYGERSYKKRGLMTPDVKDLNRVIADCKRLVPTIKELVDKLGESGEEFKQIGTDTVALGNKAHDVLTTDYADSYTRSPRNARDRRP